MEVMLHVSSVNGGVLSFVLASRMRLRRGKQKKPTELVKINFAAFHKRRKKNGTKLKFTICGPVLGATKTITYSGLGDQYCLHSLNSRTAAPQAMTDI
jgi:hypothetical protein